MATDVKPLLQKAEENMEAAVLFLDETLAHIRAGKANPRLLDGIKVDYYGTPTPLAQMATLSIPESRMIQIQPWDQSAMGEIEKAILKSDLGLTPSNDGKLIRITIPVLTEARRKELVKVTSKTCEEFKVALRNIRRDANDLAKNLKKDGDISEDESFKAQDEIQKITDTYIAKIDVIYKDKEKEILEI